MAVENVVICKCCKKLIPYINEYGKCSLCERYCGKECVVKYVPSPKKD